MDGCDLSERMLDQARKRDIHARLFAADVCRPPLDTQGVAYDAVTAVGVYSYGHLGAESTDTLLAALRPGGLLIIGVNDKFNAEGSLSAKLKALDAEGRSALLMTEHGGHIPGTGVEGWV